jgi:hypothetical protein
MITQTVPPTPLAQKQLWLSIYWQKYGVNFTAGLYILYQAHGKKQERKRV